jgi:hypothetical protein
MIPTHRATQLSQMKTAGPAINFFTSCCDFPQNEQKSAPAGAAGLAFIAPSSVRVTLTVKPTLTRMSSFA